ncbi:MAG: class I SAM-dependent methyltransferase [Candidatus Promineifilaceae bacterium]
MPTTSAAYPPEYFEKQDNSADENFYVVPRLTVHIDEPAIQALTTLYDNLLTDGMTVLDLMSSWRSHLPEGKQFASVVGHGMNSAELRENSQLNEYFLHNLNNDQMLPLNANQFDAVLCAVSVQYLQQPLEVFAEVYRVLKPGGVFIVSFSNRCFPNKAITAWIHSGDQDHISLVHSYFQLSAPWNDAHARLKSAEIPPNSDPLYMLWAYKPEPNQTNGD